MNRPLLAVTFSIILLLGSIGLNSANAAAVTTLRFNTNVDKGIPPTQGDTVFFTGQLLQADTSTGVSNATISIIQKIEFGSNQVLVTGKTDTDGTYSIPWVIDVAILGANTEQRSSGTTQGAKINRIEVTVFAKFEGNDKYISSISSDQAFEVRLNALNIKVEKQGVYLANAKAEATITITDIDNNLVEPDTLIAQFDNNPINLLRDSIGTYIFSVVSLGPGAHQLHIKAEKKVYISADVFITIEAMKRKTSFVVSLDKSSYKIGETVSVTAALMDQISSDLITGKVISGALVPPNFLVHQLTFVDGKATYTLAKTDVVGTWSVSANFLGDDSYFASGGQVSFTVSGGAITAPPPAEQKISLSKPTFVDQTGNSLNEVTVGQQVMIQAKATSKFETQQEVVYISQVKDEQGITVALSWIASTLVPGQPFEPAVSWTPEVSGDYTVEIFLWKSIKDPQPLSAEMKSTITVS